MPINLYEETTDQGGISIELFPESWDLTVQFAKFEKWLITKGKGLQAGKYIADVGVIPRIEFSSGVGGGPTVSRKCIEILSQKGIELHISEYPGSFGEIDRLQEWYLSQCDGDWEHEVGLKIETLDNPGWEVRVDLKGTNLENAEFSKIEQGLIGQDPNDWILCEKKDNQFIGFGGPRKLKSLLRVFLSWLDTRLGEQDGARNGE